MADYATKRSFPYVATKKRKDLDETKEAQIRAAKTERALMKQRKHRHF